MKKANTLQVDRLQSAVAGAAKACQQSKIHLNACIDKNSAAKEKYKADINEIKRIQSYCTRLKANVKENLQLKRQKDHELGELEKMLAQNGNDVEEDSEEVKTLLVKFNNIQNDIEVNDDMISKYINEDNKLKIKLNKKEQKLNGDVAHLKKSIGKLEDEIDNLDRKLNLLRDTTILRERHTKRKRHVAKVTRKLQKFSEKLDECKKRYTQLKKMVGSQRNRINSIYPTGRLHLNAKETVTTIGAKIKALENLQRSKRESSNLPSNAELKTRVAEALAKLEQHDQNVDFIHTNHRELICSRKERKKDTKVWNIA